MIFDRPVTIEALTMAGTQQSYLPHPTYSGVTVYVNIQPAAPQFTDGGQGMFYKGFNVYTTASGIRETDRITEVNTGKKYIVKGRQDFAYIVLPHYELYAESSTR